jgi:hypothetical protein
MFQRDKDYLIRQLKPLSAVLAQMLHLRQIHQEAEARLLINSTAQETLGLGTDLMLHLPYEHLMAMLREDTQEGLVKSLILADLLQESAQLFDAEQKPQDSYLCYLKSFNIFFEVMFVKDSSGIEQLLGAEAWQEQSAKMAQVVAALRAFDLPEAISFKLVSYYEQTGQYAQAEDLIFELIDITDDQTFVVDKGIRFFKRLRLKTDEQLIAGNLPRDEVNTALQELLELEDELAEEDTDDEDDEEKDEDAIDLD